MEQKLGLSGRISVELKLTPSLVQSIELLQLPLQILEEVVKEEVESNPFIEIEFDSFQSQPSENLLEPVPQDEDGAFDHVYRPSLRDVLIWQVKLEFDSDEDINVAIFIIDNLNASGYLEVSESEVASYCGVSVDKVKVVRQKVKRFFPAGCASYSVSECFTVQMEEFGVKERFLNALKYIHLLKPDDYGDFIQETGFAREDVEEFLRILKLLDPAPGNLYDMTQRVIPDIRVFLDGDVPVIEVIPFRFSRFRINAAYMKYATNPELRRYLVSRYQRALNLKKAIEHRERTLVRIATVVFMHQRAFLKDGSFIKPLTYREVAERLDMHESTVSRAVKDKFVQTPVGIYPFKRFFKRAVSSGYSEDAIKDRIKKIIDSEDKRNPLGDSAIASILGKLGISVARRTVAKYREEMGIPNAFKRRLKGGGSG